LFKTTGSPGFAPMVVEYIKSMNENGKKSISLLPAFTFYALDQKIKVVYGLELQITVHIIIPRIIGCI